MQTIDNNLALSVKPIQTISPTEALGQNVSISDMLARMQSTQEQTATSQFALQQAQRKQADQDAIESAIGQNTTIDDQGQVTTDHPAILSSLKTPKQQAIYTQMMPGIDKAALDHSIDINARQNILTQNEMALASGLKAAVAPQMQASAGTDATGAPLPAADSVSDAQRQQAYQTFRANYAKLDPGAASQLPPAYDPATVDPVVNQILSDGQTRINKGMTSLQIAQMNKDLADAREINSKVDRTTPQGAMTYATNMANAASSIVAKYKDSLSVPQINGLLEGMGFGKIAVPTGPPKQIAQVSGDKISDADATDENGKPLSADSRTEDHLFNVMRNPDGTTHYQETQVTPVQAAQIARSKALANQADARAALLKIQGDPTSPQYKLAAQRLAIEQANTDIKQNQLELAQQKQSGKQNFDASDRRIAISGIQKAIEAAGAAPGSTAAQKMWDAQADPYNKLGMDLPAYSVTQQPGYLSSLLGTAAPAAPAPTAVKPKPVTPAAPPATTGKAAHQKDLEAYADANKLPRAQVIQQWKDAHNTVIP